MAKEKAPAFLFYAKDFLTDGNVAGMTLEELGAYVKFLCYAWLEEGLPTDPRRLANMIGESPALVRRIWPALDPCFREISGRYQNPRLEEEREKLRAREVTAREKGQKGARRRWPAKAPRVTVA